MRHADLASVSAADLEDVVEARAQASRKFAVTFLRAGLFCLSAKEVAVSPVSGSHSSSGGAVVFPLYVLVECNQSLTRKL